MVVQMRPYYTSVCSARTYIYVFVLCLFALCKTYIRQIGPNYNLSTVRAGCAHLDSHSLNRLSRHVAGPPNRLQYNTSTKPYHCLRTIFQLLTPLLAYRSAHSCFISWHLRLVSSKLSDMRNKYVAEYFYFTYREITLHALL